MNDLGVLISMQATHLVSQIPYVYFRIPKVICLAKNTLLTML